MTTFYRLAGISCFLKAALAIPVFVLVCGWSTVGFGPDGPRLFTDLANDSTNATLLVTFLLAAYVVAYGLLGVIVVNALSARLSDIAFARIAPVFGYVACGLYVLFGVTGSQAILTFAGMDDVAAASSVYTGVMTLVWGIFRAACVIYGAWILTTSVFMFRKRGIMGIAGILGLLAGTGQLASITLQPGVEALMFADILFQIALGILFLRTEPEEDQPTVVSV